MSKKRVDIKVGDFWLNGAGERCEIVKADHFTYSEFSYIEYLADSEKSKPFNQQVLTVCFNDKFGTGDKDLDLIKKITP